MSTTPDATTAKKPRKQRPIPTVLTSAQADAIMGTLDVDNHNGLRRFVEMATMRYGGLRVSEVCALTPADVQLDGRQLFVIRDSKRGGCRNVPVDPRLLPWLRRWELARPPEGTRFFTHKYGEGLLDPSTAALWRSTKTAAQRAAKARPELAIDPETVHPHGWRHFAATSLYRATRDILLTGRLLGHRQVSTTTIYISVAEDDLREAMASMAAAK